MSLVDVILADPPWQYNDRKATRRDNPSRAPKFGIGAQGKYSLGTMSLADLCDMGPLVQGVSAPDAYLFLWATCPRLDAAIELIRAWGFRFVTVAFIWEKLTGKSGVSFAGPGRYTFSNVEPVLLGVRGKCWHPATGYKPKQVVRAPHPRVRAPHPRHRLTGKIIHSRKPEEIQDQIDRWLRPHAGPSPFLELFATRPRPDRPAWTCLGYDVTGRDIRDDLADLGAQLCA